ncbi:hypothetical protein BV898_04603 [Hypsibius exemplaris]|uniref:Uncharacterized protein n=1 Tax=Hypsibius exemplaris TaxID=2072580 RepID=A0A1W0X1P8_HYPEX|nr:hypothetical protein BV898_04603 [Hypsibius exemplaris]
MQTLAAALISVAVLILSVEAQLPTGTTGCAGPTDFFVVNATRKSQVRAIMKAIETGDQSAFAAIHPNPEFYYIQHALGVPDGLNGVQGLLTALKNSSRVQPLRIFQDGEYVFVHTNFLSFVGQPFIGFDIFRYEDGVIVEHWDQLQPTPTENNPSGWDVFAGPVIALRQTNAQTKANKDLVRRFVNDVLVKKQVQNLGQYFNGNALVQHNPSIGDGASAWLAAIAARVGTPQSVEYIRTRITLGEGDFVLVASEGKIGGVLSAFYELFRVENGKIAEHWDAVQAIPPRAEWRNNNGKF